jgi:ABC-2 type transport system permease protein
MRKLLNLVKKEIRELITIQLIISLLFTLVLFYFIGQLAKKEMKEAAKAQRISALDLDDSQFSQELIRGLESANFKIELIKEKDKEKAIDSVKASDSNLLLVIPEGFGKSISEFKIKEIETYTFLRSFSISATRNSAIFKVVISAINNYLSNDFLKKKIPETNPENLKNPIKGKDFVFVKDKSAEASASDIAGFVISQTVFVPIILMLIIISSSQMVISAIAMEKQNKTLETLLTVPIGRASIITAKMVSSGLVGLILAVIYMVGFRRFMGGLYGNIPGGSSQMSGVIQKLGLSLNTSSYIILGISLFFAIICALAMATILGVLAEDFRSAQTLIMPIMFLVMIPYFIFFLSDIKSFSLPVRILILAIPFTHPFLTTQNIFLENYSAVFYGILYMFIVFVILVAIAAHIFSTDKILTMKLRLGRKRTRTL